MIEKPSAVIDRYVMKTYGRQPVTFVKGEGVMLYDDEGKAYRDFLAGISVANLGHTHPEVTQAIIRQAGLLTHVSNLFYTEPQAEVARLLVENSFADKVFFCNSGAEANEGALKLSRLWGKKFKNGAYGVITALNSFHGRTMRTLTATGQKKIQEGYDPLPPGFTYVPYGDLKALEAEVDETTAAVMLEPVLGEGGVVIPPPEYLQGVREICDRTGAMLIFDEVQTGMGRTGRLFAHQHWGVEPDVMTLAKAMANGLPVGAVLAKGPAAELWGPGSHGTTFGAGPVVMAAVRVVLETMTAPGFMDHVNRVGRYFLEKLEVMADGIPGAVKEVRGMGLMLGLELNFSGVELVKTLLQRGFVVNCTQDKVIRFLPPLVVSDSDVDAVVEALAQEIPAAAEGKV